MRKFVFLTAGILLLSGCSTKRDWSKPAQKQTKALHDLIAAGRFTEACEVIGRTAMRSSETTCEEFLPYIQEQLGALDTASVKLMHASRIGAGRGTELVYTLQHRRGICKESVVWLAANDGHLRLDSYRVALAPQ